MSGAAEKVKSWLKNKYNLGFVLLLIASFVIRVYFLMHAAEQPLWWDEAEYMATAKHWASGVPYDLNPQRPPLFQMAAFILLKFGLEETALKFFLVLLPSLAVVACVYALGKEMFDERIALLAATGSALVWSYLFWTVRFQPDFFSLCLQLLAVLFIWKTFNQDNMRWAILAGVFSGIAFYFKISALLIPAISAIFALWVDKARAFTTKKYWIMIAAYLITLLPFLVWQAIVFGDPIAFSHGYADLSGKLAEGWQPGWMALSYFYSFSKMAFFIPFILGAIITIGAYIITFDIKMQSRASRLDPYMFSALMLIVTTLFFIFFIRGTIEDRWVFIIAPFIFFFSARGCLVVSDYLSKIKKPLGTILIVLIVVLLAYAQLSHANNIIEVKKSSYLPIKDASLYLKEISSPNESILSVSYTQTTTYAERRVYSYARMDAENFTQLLEEKHPSYLMLSIHEPHHPTWLISQQFYQNGGVDIMLPLFNSTVSVSPQGAVQLDIKPAAIIDGKYRFDFVYPTDMVNGVFVYKITYLADNL